MEGEFGRVLRRVLGDTYDEMFPAPPKIEQPRRAMPEPPAETVEERQIKRPRIERQQIERIEPEVTVERQIMRSRLEGVGPEPEARPEPAIPVVLPLRRQALDVDQLLSSRRALRQAILIREILGPPKALQ